MERSLRSGNVGIRVIALVVAVATLVSTAGCPALIATGIYAWQGGNVVPAECNALEGQRVVVVCRPPASHEFRHATASRSIARRVSELLAANVRKIDVVNPREVDNWVDQRDWGDYRELAESVRADKIVQIDLERFSLDKGKTLYQGDAEVNIIVYDMQNYSKPEWERPLGQILYPTNSGVPAQDKPVQQFEREFVEIVADRVAIHFYKHDPNASFAIDALANR